MKILHICNYYKSTKVYKNLIESLNLLGHENKVFVALKEKTTDVNENIYFSHCISKWMKISLFLKTIVSFISLVRTFNASFFKFDVVHCHTLFSDGFIGLLLKLMFGKKYIVTVRNTDFTIYMKYFPHLRFLAKIIISKSEGTIFISPAYMNKFRTKYPWIDSYKTEVITNGVDEFWLNNYKKERGYISTDTEIKILSIGYFDSNKNFKNAYLSTKKLVDEGLNIKHSFVGGDDIEFNNVYNIHADCNFSYFYGVIKKNEELLDIINEHHILLVPSFKETFGLVYIEALSQGLSVIYSDNEGIDGLFTSCQCISCNPTSINSISHAIKSLINNNHKCNNLAIDEFSWKLISSKYVSIYEKL